MQKLINLLKCFDEETDARWWVGKRPMGDEVQAVESIMAQVGLPTAPATDPFSLHGLDRLGWTQAAHVLTVAGTTSLAYDNYSPTNSALSKTKAALAELAGDAAFFSNGQWEPNNFISWKSVTRATFDCGVVGFDAEHAFIFWVEEED